MNTHLRPIQPAGAIQRPVSPLVLKPKACNACRTRKVRCDRKQPCSNCALWSVECVFPLPIRRCRRIGSKSPSDGLQPARDDPRLRKRIEDLEETLRELKAIANGQISEKDFAKDLAEGTALPSDTLVGPGRSLKLAAQVEGLVQSSAQQSTNVTWASPVASSWSDGLGSSTRSLHIPWTSLNGQPSPDTDVVFGMAANHLALCWRLFLENADPLVKVMHQPSVERILGVAVRDRNSLGSDQQAVLFSTCFASITTMPTSLVERNFGMTKVAVLAAFGSAVDHSLACAEVLTTDNILTLQALVLYLSFSFLNGDVRRAWALTGLVRRLGSPSRKVSVFENEMRRRLWWQLWYIDYRATEDHSQGNSTPDMAAGPEYPLNIYDADLDVKATAPPVSRPGWTSTSFSLIRLDVANTSKKIDNDIPEYQKEEYIRDCGRRIQTNYLQYCDGSQPIHWLAKHVGHVLIMEMWFKLYFRRGSLPAMTSQLQNMRERLFGSAIDIVDNASRIKAEPEAQRWRWLLSAYLQFLPLRFLLDELNYRRNGEQVDRAWEVVDTARMGWTKDMESCRNGLLLSQLMEQAKDRRKGKHPSAIYSADTTEHLPSGYLDAVFGTELLP